MPDERRVVHVDVVLDGAHGRIRGIAHLSEAETREFNGWLELLALLTESRADGAIENPNERS